MTNPFFRLAPFIQDYIYKNKWDQLRDVQVEACRVIFETNNHLLLSSGTASGKTEAAFLPILTKLYENPSRSVGVLYISPLKALINDQFYRLEDFLQEVNIPVTKWHGDVSQNDKQKLLKNPQGVLQITPESLEGMLMNKKQQVIRLFSDLRYIIVDEVHYFMGCERGIQLLCILERIQRLIGITPTRIGLSATLGDYSMSEKWLSSGTNIPVSTPRFSSSNQKIRISLEHFTLLHPELKDGELSTVDMEYFEYIYKNTYGKKCIIFGNAKMELERIISTLHEIAENRGDFDVFNIHHGNISAVLRQEAELMLKTSDIPMVTGATVTLELGIDIGQLQRIMQLDAPFSVSSFIQRLGRTGRRGEPSEIWFACKEYQHLPNENVLQQIDWGFLRCIAVIQLYVEERFIEPLDIPNQPFGLLYHQTMSILTSMGEVSSAQLAQNVLTLSPFKKISQDDYRNLLNHLVKIKHIEKSERGGLLIGLSAERIIGSFKFFAVFETPEEYAVRNESEDIGSVQVKFPVGERFALAGKTWEVTEVNENNKVLYVKYIKGRSNNMFIGGGFLIHTKILKKMLSIINSENIYGYLQPRAAEKLKDIRNLTAMSHINSDMVIGLGGNHLCILPWLGTRSVITLLYVLGNKGIEITDKNIPYWITVKTDLSINELINILKNIKNEDINKYSLEYGNAKLEGKFNDFIPSELLKKQYIEDFIDVEDMQKNLEFYNL